ncbi:hypothetical protein KIPB_011934, partial [Kipferlia bialata]
NSDNTCSDMLIDPPEIFGALPHAATYCDGSIYLLSTGCETTLQILSLETLQWSVAQSTPSQLWPVALTNPISFALGSSLFLYGMDVADRDRNGTGEGRLLMWSYDTTTGQWSEECPPPRALYGMPVVVGDVAYIVPYSDTLPVYSFRRGSGGDTPSMGQWYNLGMHPNEGLQAVLSMGESIVAISTLFAETARVRSMSDVSGEWVECGQMGTCKCGVRACMIGPETAFAVADSEYVDTMPMLIDLSALTDGPE